MWSLAASDVPSLQEKGHSAVESPSLPTASWQKSSSSGSEGECVQIIRSQAHVWVRDSKNPLGPVLGFTRRGWAVFIGGVRRGEFDGSGVRPDAGSQAIMIR